MCANSSLHAMICYLDLYGCYMPSQFIFWQTPPSPSQVKAAKIFADWFVWNNHWKDTNIVWSRVGKVVGTGSTAPRISQRKLTEILGLHKENL